MSTMYAILHDDEAAELCRWQAERIAELERREALLTAFVVAVETCDWVNADPKLVSVADGCFGKLTLAGFPW